jgi:hypothetical protein
MVAVKLHSCNEIRNSIILNTNSVRFMRVRAKAEK